MISPSAIIAEGVTVDADAIIDDDVVVGANCHIGPRVHLYSKVKLAQGVQVFDGAIIGAAPQDLKYQSGSAGVQVGASTVIREYSTINSSVSKTNPTHIGSDCLLMAYSHVGHDSQLGNSVVLANRVQLGGHVVIGQGAVLGGGVAVQQFNQIGEFSFVGGTLKAVRDIPPWSRALGEPIKWAGLNLIALRKSGLNHQEIKARRELLDQMYTSSSLSQFFENLTQEVEQIGSHGLDYKKVLLQWYQGSRNGALR